MHKMNILLKVVPANAHHQAGHAENVSKQVKTLTFNVLQGMPLQDGIHYQGVLDIMAGAINSRVSFIDHDGEVHTANSFLQSALQISQTEPQDLSNLPNTKNKEIKNTSSRIVQENRRILTLYACQYAQSLLSWQISKYGQDPKIQNGDVVIVLDKIVLHHYKSARRAIGRVVQTSVSGNDFCIKMVSQGEGDRRPPAVKHRKHLLLLCKSDEKTDSKGRLEIDPWSDPDVSEIMAQPKLEMEAQFLKEGQLRLPALSEAFKQAETFKDPEDFYVAHDFSNPMSALNLQYPTAFKITKNRVLTAEPAPKAATAIPKKTVQFRDVYSGESDNPIVVSPPPLRTASGRASRPPVRLNL
jgi:hypothetical protein